MKECIYKQKEDEIWECSECKKELAWLEGDIEYDISYCPYCGLKIKNSRRKVNE